MTDDLEKQGWYRTGSVFGIHRDRAVKINEEIADCLKNREKYPTNQHIEKFIAENYKIPGECYIAGFALSTMMITRKNMDDTQLRKAMWFWLLGIGNKDPFGEPMLIEIVRSVTEGFDPTVGLREAMQDHEKYMEKKRPNPEIV